jgi:hypothetical protein
LKKKWDVFISHASEDKETVVRPLASKLKKLGIKVWVDENELTIGDSLSRRIDDGLARSDAGVVVLSKSFFDKRWPEYEIRGLNARLIAGMGKILPIWHEVTPEDLLNYSPSLGDLLAGNTSESLDTLAMKIVRAINPDLYRAIMRKMAREVELSKSVAREIPLADIERGPVWHTTLPQKLVNRIALVACALEDEYPKDMNEWLDGFQRDAHPTREIEIWEDIAARYQRVVASVSMDEEERHSVYSALLIASLTGHEAAADIIVKKFGGRAEDVVDAMKFDASIFTPLTEEDLSRQRIMGMDVESYQGPESGIDVQYLRELVSEGKT